MPASSRADAHSAPAPKSNLWPFRRRVRDVLSGESGAVSVELVVATPLLLLVLLLIVQFTVWSHATHLAQAAASRGLAAARIHESTAAEGHHAARNLLDSLGSATLTEIAIDVDRDTDLASARITGRAASVVPGLHLPVRAAASGPVERVVPAVLGVPNREEG